MKLKNLINEEVEVKNQTIKEFRNIILTKNTISTNNFTDLTNLESTLNKLKNDQYEKNK